MRFAMTLQNNAEFDALMATWGHMSNPPAKTLNSVAYKVINGVLMHFSGGNLIFGGFTDWLALTLPEDGSDKWMPKPDAAINDGKAINDHICHCGNDRCSKTEKSCWRCGAPIQ